MSYLGLESVRHGNTGACIEDIFRLHFPDAQLVADLTFGKGRFWKWPSSRLPGTSTMWLYPPDVVGLDIESTFGTQIKSDYRHVPLKDKSVDVAVFDPPFIFTRGVQRISGTKRGFLGSEGVMEQAFPHNAEELRSHTHQAFREGRRIARCGMILKGMDLITGQHPNWWTYQTMADTLWGDDMQPEDMLIQVSLAARLKDPRWKNQLHFRRRHVIYLIYKW